MNYQKLIEDLSSFDGNARPKFWSPYHKKYYYFYDTQTWSDQLKIWVTDKEIKRDYNCTYRYLIRRIYMAMENNIPIFIIHKATVFRENVEVIHGLNSICEFQFNPNAY